MQSASNYLMLERRNSVERYGSTLSAWALILGGFSIAAALYVSIRNYISIPFEDQWVIVEELRQFQASHSLRFLWDLHNEHRLPFAKLLMMADLFWYKGHNVSLYIEIYAVQLLHLFTFAWAMRRGALWPGWMIAAGSGLAAFALFWTTQYQTFINPFGVSVLPAYVFATVAVTAMLSALEDSKRYSPWLLLMVIAAFVSEASLANGLLVWPLAIVMAIRFRLRLSLVAALALVAAASIAVYLIGYHNPNQHANPVQSLRSPGLVLQYLLIYFGCTWFAVNVAMGKLFALAGTAMAIVCYLREMARSKPRAFAIAMLSLCMFLLGTGALTALGRINFPLAQAASSRYQTSALLFWLCLSLYVMDAAYRHNLRSAMLATGGALMLATAMLPSFPLALADAQETADRVHAAALPVYADVKDDREIQAKMIVSADLVFSERPFLQSQRSAFYAEPRYQLLRKPISQSFRLAPLDRCFGSVDSSRAIIDRRFPGWELYGWAWDHQAMRPVESLVATTDDSTVTGVGDSGLPRTDVETVFKEVSDPRIGFHLYLQGAGAFASVKVYGIVDEGKSACLVTPAFAIPKKP